MLHVVNLKTSFRIFTEKDFLLIQKINSQIS